MAVIRFDPNTPVEVALKYDAGRQVKSRIENAPDQMMYTVCGDDTIYLPLVAAEKITQLGVKKLELISICKRQQGTMVKWEVKRLSEATEPARPTNSFDQLATDIDASPLSRKLTDSINLERQRKAVTPQCTHPVAVATVPAPKAPTQTQPDSTPPIAHTVISKLMASSLIAAFDATQECQRYAHAHGVEFEFQAEDIRAISNTIFIALSKDPRFGEPQKINEGAQPWHQ